MKDASGPTFQECANLFALPADQYAKLVASHLRLRDKLLEVAKECARCNGTGLITRHFEGNEDKPAWDADDQPCPDCEDIRAALDE